MTDPRWRRSAKELLYNYTTNRYLLREAERDVIFGLTADRDHRYRRGGVSNPTLMKAQLLSDKYIVRLRRETKAVEELVRLWNTSRRIDRLRLRLLDLVYFQNECGLLAAAARLEIGERTAKRWNRLALEFLAGQMGWRQAENFSEMSNR